MLLLAAIGLALAFRVTALGTYGFSEDEAAKLRAIDAYARGDFTANAEHPMLMKLAMWASLTAARRWNGWEVQPEIAPETALRLPNAIAGSATVAGIYGVARIFFGPLTGLAAAFFVAVDPNVTALNRIGKEDTFSMLFLTIAIWCYERAKLTGVSDPRGAQRWYRRAGAAFGLMLASKYIPWFFGYYALFNYAADPHPGANRPRQLPYYACLAGTFVAANVAALLPGTWAYCLAYIRGEQMTHVGYIYGGELYTNTAIVDAAGVPVTFFLHMIVTKVPLAVLACAAAGLVPLALHQRQRGFVWLRVFLVLPLLTQSLLASKFQRYALPTLLVLDVLAGVGLIALVRVTFERAWAMRVRYAAAAFLVTGVAGLLLAAQVQVAPFFSTFQNVIGAAQAPPVTVFPEEAYDYGLREVVAAIAAASPPGVPVLSDAPLAVERYLKIAGREDLPARALSRTGVLGGREQWIIVQDRHIYFENASIVAQLRRAHPPWREIALRGTRVLQVFRIDI